MKNVTLTPKQQLVLDRIKTAGPQNRRQLQSELHMRLPEIRSVLRKLNTLRLIKASPPRSRIGVWHVPEDADRAREIREANKQAVKARKRAADAKSQRERSQAKKRGGPAALRLETEAAIREFCESPVVQRTIPAGEAQRMTVRGPASVWQLAQFAGRG